MAIFVEGQTEQLFVARFLWEVVGKKGLRLETLRGEGGKSFPRRYERLNVVSNATGKEVYEVLLVDSTGYGRLMSDVRDEYDKLTKRGYSRIVAMRDVDPNTRDELPTLVRFLPYGVKTKPIKVDIVLIMMEIETWFIAEHEHFLKIDHSLSIETISQKMGYDPSGSDMELLDKPSKDLDSIYSIVGKRYLKRKSGVEEIVGHLDFARLYGELTDRYASLKQFVAVLDEFFV